MGTSETITVGSSIERGTEWRGCVRGMLDKRRKEKEMRTVERPRLYLHTECLIPVTLMHRPFVRTYKMLLHSRPLRHPPSKGLDSGEGPSSKNKSRDSPPFSLTPRREKEGRDSKDLLLSELHFIVGWTLRWTKGPRPDGKKDSNQCPCCLPRMGFRSLPWSYLPSVRNTHTGTLKVIVVPGHS